MGTMNIPTNTDMAIRKSILVNINKKFALNLSGKDKFKLIFFNRKRNLG